MFLSSIGTRVFLISFCRRSTAGRLDSRGGGSGVSGRARTPFPVSSALAPLQLGAQHVEEILFQAQQLHTVCRLAAENAVAVIHGHADLTVDAEIGLFFSCLYDDFDFGSITHHQGAMG